ncbi:MAG: DNA translocase FtsK 4TM domain-containing protein, partial [Acidimicrobiales bacterium]
MLGRLLLRALAAPSVEGWGVAVVVAGVLAALGIWAPWLGVAGKGLQSGTSYGVGWARLLLPVLAVSLGGVMLAGRSGRVLARTAVGAVVCVLAVAGLADILAGAPAAGGPANALRGSGGALGAGIGSPLAHLLGSWGAGIVLGVVCLLAICALTGVSVARLVASCSVAAHHLGEAASEAWSTRARRDPSGASLPGDPDGVAGPAGDDAETLSAATSAGTVAGVSTGLAPPGAEELEASGPGMAAVPPTASSLPATEDGGRGHGERAGASGDPEQLQLRLEPPGGDWKLPALQLLAKGQVHAVDRRVLAARGRVLEEALAAHGVETRLVGMTPGPTVTRFELELGAGVKVARVTNLHKDIAYAMASADVRILAPIPGRSAIGVEVPNQQRQVVALADLLASEEARKARHPLEVALGRDIAGRPVMVNLAEMPHVLIAGATGSGKSSAINSLLASVLMRATPDQVRLILVDPKRVELGQYNGLPHLLSPVVVDPKKAANALSWAVKEMERRYDLLAEHGVRDITGYNDAVDRGELGPIGGPSVAAQVAAAAARA